MAKALLSVAIKRVGYQLSCLKSACFSHSSLPTCTENAVLMLNITRVKLDRNILDNLRYLKGNSILSPKIPLHLQLGSAPKEAKISKHLIQEQATSTVTQSRTSNSQEHTHRLEVLPHQTETQFHQLLCLVFSCSTF